MPARVSVAIPNWNGRRFLGPCLTALRAQTRPPDEVLVVDSASTDGSAEYIATTFPEVRLVRLGGRPGIAAAFNACIANTTGDAVALLNNDTEPDKGWLAALAGALDAHPCAGVCASKIMFMSDRRTINAAGDSYRPDGRPGNRGVWQRDRGQFDRPEWVFGAMAAAALYRRAALAEVGPFDEDLGSYCEDVDWAFRAHLLGWGCRYVPEAVVYHHGSATGGGALASYSCGRNFPLVFVKDMPPGLFRRHLWRMLLRQGRDTLETLPHLREPAARARLRGQAAALQALPAFLAKRRRLQRRRRVPEEAIAALLEGGRGPGAGGRGGETGEPMSAVDAPLAGGGRPARLQPTPSAAGLPLRRQDVAGGTFAPQLARVAAPDYVPAPSPQPPAPGVASLTVVVPAYNEERRLPDTLERMVDYFARQDYPWQVCVVDDGSADATADIARAWAAHEPRVRLIANDHRGKAYAVRTGILAADSDYVAFSDADLSVPIDQVPRLLATLDAGADVAFGSREGPGARRHGEPAYRHLMGRVYNGLYRTLLLPGISDSQCGFKAFRTPVAHDLFRRMRVYGGDARPIKGGMVTGFDTELLFLARRCGYRLVEVGVDWHYGKASKVRPLHDTVRMLLDVLRILAYARRGRYGAAGPCP